ncbi:hypothetical protein [Actinomadura viridis]|uniref:Uncharacterized protein n=1 Tax=Actinomadura viridis TaxID=58110 RepID=A0A931GNA6_9ACTN|nr:hypothetical protein [Actinomadura viridis]MBG6093557.1 hypothetical protein [Actinomadura viridis]
MMKRLAATGALALAIAGGQAAAAPALAHGRDDGRKTEVKSTNVKKTKTTKVVIRKTYVKNYVNNYVYHYNFGDVRDRDSRKDAAPPVSPGITGLAGLADLLGLGAGQGGR